MITFENLLARLPIEELRRLAGASAVELLDADFPNAGNQEGLAALIIGQHTLEGVLASKEIRSLALKELSPPEGVEICKALGLPHLDPIRTLENLDTEYNPVHGEKFYGFFGVAHAAVSTAPSETTRRARPLDRMPESRDQLDAYGHLRRLISARDTDVLVQMPLGTGKLRTVASAILDVMRSERDDEAILWLSAGAKLCAETCTELLDRWARDGTRDLTLYRAFADAAAGDTNLPDFQRLSSAVVVADLSTFLSAYKTACNNDPQLASNVGKKLRSIVLHDACFVLQQQVREFLQDYKASGGGNVIGITAAPAVWFADRGLSQELAKSFKDGVVTVSTWRQVGGGPKLKDGLATIKFDSLASGTDVPIELHGASIAEHSLVRLSEDRARNQQILNAIIAEVQAGRSVVFHASTAEQARTFAGVLFYHAVVSVVVTADMPVHKQSQQMAIFQTRPECKVLCTFEVAVSGKESAKATTAILSHPYSSFDRFASVISRFAVDREENDVKVILLDDCFEPFNEMPRYFNQWNTMEIAGGL